MGGFERVNVRVGVPTNLCVKESWSECDFHFVYENGRLVNECTFYSVSESGRPVSE